jgi:hypothetical protein
MNRQPLTRQHGISLTGLILILIILAVIAVLGMKIVPTVIEYKAISKAIAAAKESGTTVREIQAAFDKRAEAGYIDVLKGTDLEISKVDNDYVVSFSYQKKIPLMGSASLVIDYEGTTAKTGAKRAANK